MHTPTQSGDEYEIVILSTVRSRPLREIRNKEHVQPDGMWMGENLGFITDPHQINVGITRSKCGLVITGTSCVLCILHLLRIHSEEDTNRGTSVTEETVAEETVETGDTSRGTCVTEETVAEETVETVAEETV